VLDPLCEYVALHVADESRTRAILTLHDNLNERRGTKPGQEPSELSFVHLHAAGLRVVPVHYPRNHAGTAKGLDLLADDLPRTYFQGKHFGHRKFAPCTLANDR